MAFQALYRKWRPDTFADMIGQDAVTATLKNQVLSGRVGHAYLFCGTRGTGKTSAAKIMARAVNCPNAAEHGGEPCNECESCRAIKNGSSTEVFEIDAASKSKVEDIRAVLDEISYPPITGEYKVYIIDEVHMLSPSAHNALLKTIEEPPPYLIFILATTDPQKLPATVLSRCQRYDFKRIGKRLIEDRFRQILDSEGYNVEDKAISYIAELADGSMRDGLSIMDQCLSYAMGGRLSYEAVLKIMGAVDTSVYSRLYRSILSGDIEGSLIESGGIINNGADVMQIISDMVRYLRNVLLAGSLKDGGADLLDVSEERLVMAKEDAARTSKTVLLSMLMEFSELANRARYAPNKRLLLEMLIIRLCAGNAGKPVPDTGASSEVRPGISSEVRSGASLEVRPGTSSEVRPGASSEARPGISSEVRPGASSEARLGASSEARSDAGNDHEAQLPIDAKAGTRPAASAGSGSDTRPAAASGKSTGTPQDKQDTGKSQKGMPVNEQLGILKKNWPNMVQKLAPSNRKLFLETMLKTEGGKLVMIFKSSINFKLAAANIEENGVLKLREMASGLIGEDVKFMARVARPGEMSREYDHATDEELASINFHIDIED